MGELERRDSLDQALSSASLPAFCSSELDDLLTLLNPKPQSQAQALPRQGKDVAVPLTPNQLAFLSYSQPVNRTFHAVEPSPSSRPLLSERSGPAYVTSSGTSSAGTLFAQKPVPPRRASWAGPTRKAVVGGSPSTRVAHSLTSLPLVHCSSEGAAVLSTPTPFGVPPALPNEASSDSRELKPPPPESGSHPRGSPRGRESSNGQSCSGGSNCTPPSGQDNGEEAIAEVETPRDSSCANNISITQGAQMFISGAPFVFKGSTVKKEPGTQMALSSGSCPVEDPQAVAQRRLEARKERNRRAQRTFRQRQKLKMHDLEAELAELSARLDSLRTSNATLNANVSLLSKVLEVREQQRLELQRKEAEEMNHRYDRQILARNLQLYEHGPCSLSVYRREGKPVELSVKFISRMTPVQANDIWMRYGQEICQGMKLFASGVHDVGKVTQLTRELTQVMVVYVHTNPENFSKLREIGERAAPADFSIAQMMMDSAKAMGLDLTQKRAIVDKWKWLLNEHACNEAETRATHSNLQAFMPSGNVSYPFSQDFLHNNRVLDRIKHLLQEWHEAKMEYVYYAACKVMNPLQIARMISVCFPMLPNTLRLGEVLAYELGELDRLPYPEFYKYSLWPSNHPSKRSPELIAGPVAGDDANIVSTNCSQEILPVSPMCDELNGRFVPS